MTKLPVLSSKDILKVLYHAGFVDAPKRGKGSHRALVKRGLDKTRLVIVPERKTVPKGTLKAIIEQAGLTSYEFAELLKR